MILYVYAGTLFLSAFILFLVQPIIGKMILPKLGGTPQVWNTCMVFFQMVLLAGYAYTHAMSTRLNARRQLMFHAILLFLPLVILFFLYPYPFNVEWWNAPPGSNPIPSTLLVLIAIVGLPFFVVSTTAPLLQRWFVYTGHPAAKDPYFLYGASNLGSLLSLVLYPTIIEHYLSREQQAWLWAGSYVAFLAFVLYSAFTVWEPTGKLMPVLTSPPKPEPEPALAPPTESSTAVTATAPAATAAAASTAIKKGPAPKSVIKDPFDMSRDKEVDSITPWRRFRWVGLAAVPSSLMLGVITHITTDLSPIPLFWLIPLMLYLLSFILVFAKWPVVWVEKPHNFVLAAQPIAIGVMLFALWAHVADWRIAAAIEVIAFFLTALAMHGELAKDRPSVKHLTEFYLWMSVGGMVGGMFNGLIAPIIPLPYVWEFSLAVVGACLFRPVMKDAGWTDEFVGSMIDQGGAAPAPVAAKGGKVKKAEPHPKPVALASGMATPKLARNMDIILPVALGVFVIVVSLLVRNAFVQLGMYGVALFIACFYYARPVRFGLAVLILILLHGMFQNESYIHGDRSYFGIIRVKEIRVNEDGRWQGSGKAVGAKYHSLMHGNIDHGMNFWKPGVDKAYMTLADYKNPDLDRAEWGNHLPWEKTKDFSRLSSTYYHRYGPVGVIMERWNWAATETQGGVPTGNTYWAWKQNQWHADARMPASLIALSQLDGPVPGAAAVMHAFSEPPIATVGLGTGTMASYARPYMSCHFYEIDNHIKKLSLPEYKDPSGEYPTFLSWWWSDPTDLPKGKIYFTMLIDAVERGADVQVYMGDAYQRMRMPYYNINDPAGYKTHKLPPGGPNGYYKMMVVDAFSSDAIPVHLLTKEAMTMYFEKLAEDGILCVHTSNRYVELPKVVVAVANSLGFVARRGHDVSPFKGGDDDDGRTEHYTSEWVMVARKAAYLSSAILKEPVQEGKSYRKALEERRARLLARDSRANPSVEPYWDDPPSSERYIWTLDHSNLFNVLRGSRRSDDE